LLRRSAITSSDVSVSVVDTNLSFIGMNMGGCSCVFGSKAFKILISV
jgi:hypothetical protein